jgi:hypothetical protein
MKRLLVLLALLIPASLFAAGCGGQGGGSGPSAGPPTKTDLDKLNEMAKRQAEMTKKSAGSAQGTPAPSAPEKK